MNLADRPVETGVPDSEVTIMPPLSFVQILGIRGQPPLFLQMNAIRHALLYRGPHTQRQKHNPQVRQPDDPDHLLYSCGTPAYRVQWLYVAVLA